MLHIMLRLRDGYEFHESAETLDEAREFIEGRAIAQAEDTWTGDFELFFPAFWRITDEADGRPVAAGFVDESGQLE